MLFGNWSSEAAEPSIRIAVWAYIRVISADPSGITGTVEGFFTTFSFEEHPFTENAQTTVHKTINLRDFSSFDFRGLT